MKSELQITLFRDTFQSVKTNKKQLLEKMDSLIPWQDRVYIIDPISVTYHLPMTFQMVILSADSEIYLLKMALMSRFLNRCFLFKQAQSYTKKGCYR